MASKIDEILFRSLTDKLLKAFRIPTGKQRLDSTHLLSNMKRLSRLDLFVRTIEKFLKELRRSHPRILQSQVDGALTARYLDEKKGCFSRVSGEEAKKAEMLVLDDFRTEESGRIASCPAGESPTQTKVGKRGTQTARFDPRTCRRCEHRDYCQVGRGETGYRLQYTEKELRLADRRVAEETEEFREKYRRRSGIEATNAKLKRVLKIGRLRVRGLGRVRHAVTLKILGWNIRQAVRAVKARISGVFQRWTLGRTEKFHRGFEIHRPARTTGVIPQDRTTLHLLLAA